MREDDAQDPSEAFGQAVRETRVKLKISQEQLAHLANIDRSYMGAIERGEKNVTIKIVWKIATALACRPSDLIKKAENTVGVAKRRRSIVSKED